MMRQAEGLRLSLQASKLPNAVLLKYAELSEETTSKQQDVTRKEEEKKTDPLRELALSNAMDEAVTLKLIGETWFAEEQWENAVKCYMQALQIELHYFNERETDQAESMYKLGCVFEKQGKLNEACELAEEALRCREDVGDESLEVANSVELVATIYFRMGRFPEVMPLLDRVKRIREARLDSTHWDIARVLNFIGMVQDETGHLDSALYAYDSAMAIFVEYEDDLSTAKTLNNVASIYRKTGRLHEAADKYAASLEIIHRVVGVRTDEASQVLRNLGGVWSDLGQASKALECWEKSKEISIALHGPTSMDAAATMAAQADMELEQGSLHASMKGHAEALAMRTRLSGARHPETAQSSVRVGLVYEKLENYGEAEAKLSAALETLHANLGEDNLEVANVMSSLAAVHFQSGSWEKALALFERCLSVRRRILGREHLESTAIERNIGDCFSRLGEWKKAVGHYETALWIQQRKLGRRCRDAEATLEAVEKALLTQHTEAKERITLAKSTIRNENQRQQVVSEWEEVKSDLETKLSEYGAWREPNRVAVAVRQRPLERSNRVFLKPKVPKGVMSWELETDEEQEGAPGVVDDVWNSIRGWTARERENGKSDVLVRLDNGGMELVRGGDLAGRVRWLLPEGLEEGRGVVIKGLQGKVDLNGQSGRLAGMAAGSRDRVIVRLEGRSGNADAKETRREVAVKFANLEFKLQAGLEVGMAVRLVGGGGVGEEFVGQDGVLVGALDADPGCVTVRLHSGAQQHVKPAALRFLPPPHLKEGCGVMLRGLSGARSGCNGQVVRVAAGYSPYPKSLLVLLQEGATIPASVALDKIVFPPPCWAQVGRAVLVTREGYRRGVKGKIVGADGEDESRVLVAIPGRRQHVNLALNEVEWVLPAGLEVGTLVRIGGLEGHLELNGKSGKVVQASDSSSDRVVVSVDGVAKHVQVLASKLQRLKEEPEAA